MAGKTGVTMVSYAMTLFPNKFANSRGRREQVFAKRTQTMWDKTFLLTLISASVLVLTSCTDSPVPSQQSGIVGYERVENIIVMEILEPNHIIIGTAECPSGKRILGGGGFTLLENQSGISTDQYARAFMPIERSEPIGEGWSIAMRNSRSVAIHNARLHVIAICANVSP